MSIRLFRRSVVFLMLTLTCFFVNAQVSKQLDNAVKQLQNDSQMKHALLGFYVVNSNTGAVICDVNSETGMSPASSQKIITAATAFDLLGTDYRYETGIGYSGKIENNVLHGDLFIEGSGDPTLGSWRFSYTKRDSILKSILTVLYANNIKRIEGNIVLDGLKFSYQPTPGGWCWDDMGNYYGAGCWGINWNENQFDIILKTGRSAGDGVQIVGTNPELQMTMLTNLLTTGPKGSGDNAYVFLPPYAVTGFIEGTVPAGESSFKVSAAMPNPPFQLANELQGYLSNNGISLTGMVKINRNVANDKEVPFVCENILDHLYSPSLNEIVYWFLQKSINLYGEALVKSIALNKGKEGATDTGVEFVRQYWQSKGVERSALKMIDGSGLSPQNQITPKTLVQVLQYSRKQSWFTAFYKALPSYNNMKMKSGTIGGVKAYAGYHTSSSGVPYTFTIIINNYDGAHSSIVQKMFKVLDVLK